MKLTKTKALFLFNLFLLLVVGFMTVYAFTEFNTLSGAMPRLAGCTACFLLAIELVKEWHMMHKYTDEELYALSRKNKERYDLGKLEENTAEAAAETEEAGAGNIEAAEITEATEQEKTTETTEATEIPETTEQEKKPVVKLWMLIAYSVFIFLGFKYVGYVYTVPVFLFIYLKVHMKESWKLSLILPIVVGIVIYLVFCNFMHLRGY